MGKYEPLTRHLLAQSVGRISMSFSDIERVTGLKLPNSAVRHRAWWSNNADNNVMTRAWLDAGFESEQVDLAGRKLTFRRVGPTRLPTESAPPSAGAPPSPDGNVPKLALFGWLRGTVSVAPGVDLTLPADPEWSQRLDDE